MLGNHTFVLDVLIVVSFNFGKSKKSHRLNLWQFSSVSKHFYIKEDLDIKMQDQEIKKKKN